jgi:glutathione synthase/RimK-type ligase-like ATP-grasp enzyme
LILLWGLPHDPILVALSEHLRLLDAEAVVLDQRRAEDTTIELGAGPPSGGLIHLAGRRIQLDQVTAIYARPHDTTRLLAAARASPGSDAWRRALAVDHAVLAWLEVTRALVVNRPSAMAANGSKPLQLMQLRSVGFRTPETLVTTDPSAAAAFCRRHGEVVYKSVSGVRSKVARVRAEHLERLDDVVWCPTQFQRHIGGREYRVHVVGDAIFSVEVVSAADDYRYPEDEAGGPEIRAMTIPAEVAARCRRFASANALHLAGLDLRRESDGGWYCFEANPSPAFTYYEHASGQPIAAAVARLLAEGLNVVSSGGGESRT